MSSAQLEELLDCQPEAMQDEILSIDADARDLACGFPCLSHSSPG